MKCIGKLSKIGIAIFFAALFLWGCRAGKVEKPEYVTLYETEVYNRTLYLGELFANDLCVTSENVFLNGYQENSVLHAAGLFDIKEKKVVFADRIHDRLFPASTTKLMTAYLVLKYGNLNDVVTVSENAVALEPEAQVCGLQPGDKISLYDLLCGLLLWSGNDSAVAIAEHMCGSIETFAQKMNEEAWNLGATRTHFVNPHGLHNDEHYTTAYDLYLIFNACISKQQFLDIISLPSYIGTITGADGTIRQAEWFPTNFYSAGLVSMPPGVHIFGGKTGTTDEAGSCVILYSENSALKPYISIIMGAEEKEFLYEEMTKLLTVGEGTT